MPVWIALGPLYLIAFFMAMCISSKHCIVTKVRDRPVSPKEGKNYTRRLYIYTAILIGNIGFAAGFYLNAKDVRYVLGYDYLGPGVIAICLMMDIAFIKPKNFKYAYKSYLENDNDDSYQRVPDAQISIQQQQAPGMVHDPEAQF